MKKEGWQDERDGERDKMREGMVMCGNS